MRKSCKALLALTLVAFIGCGPEASYSEDVDGVSSLPSSLPRYAERLARLGAQNPWGFNDDWGIAAPGTMSEQTYRLSREAGIGWVRYWVYMHNVQRADGSVDWSVVDRAVEQASGSGLDVFLSFAWPSAYMTPNHPSAYVPWGCSRLCLPGEACIAGGDLVYDSLGKADCSLYSGFDIDRFQAFVRAAVARYGNRVRYFGFGNEFANPVFWRSQGYVIRNGVRYDIPGGPFWSVFAPAYDAAHAEAAARGYTIDVVGPETDLVHDLAENLRQERAIGRRVWDVISIHHYAGPLEGFLDVARPYRDFGGARPLWIGEAPFPTGAGSGEDTSFGVRMSLYIEAMLRGEVNRAFLWAVRARAASDPGIIDHQGVPNAGYARLARLLCPAGACLVPAAVMSLQDLTGDRMADFADFSRGAQAYWVHQNHGPGGYTPRGEFVSAHDLALPRDTQVFLVDLNNDGRTDHLEVSAGGAVTAVVRGMRATCSNVSSWGAGRQPLVGDFNGDGVGDLATRSLVTGEIVLTFLRVVGGTCEAIPTSTVAGTSMVGADWQVLVADFNGDRLSDYADHHLSSGYFWIHLNLGNGTFSGFRDDRGMGRTRPNTGDGQWATVVGDFSGDGWADFADLHRPTGLFWVHANKPSSSFITFSGEREDFNWGQAMPETGDWLILGKH